MPGYTLDDGITLKNKLGAVSHDELETAEADYVSYRLLQFELGNGPSGQFDAAHLKAIHLHLFQDVYEWAGHTRDERVMFPVIAADARRSPSAWHNTLIYLK